MRFYHRLRWRLIGAPLLGVLVGATSMVILTYIFAFLTAPDILRQELTALIADPTRLAETERIILGSFQRNVFVSIAFAAGGAVVAGVVYSFILWRSLVIPLRQIAASSQRVANGRYGERVDVPHGLGEAITQMVTSFNLMAGVLEHIEETRMTLIGNVTHELRTPLTSLRGYVEGMEDGLFPPIQETFEVMEREIGRLNRLIEDIQTLSRVEAGAIRLEPQTFDLRELLALAAAQFQPQSQNRQIFLDMHTPPVPVPVLADRDRVVQILTNLIGNAMRYTPDGGTITLEITPDIENRQAALAVRDSGVGIPAESIPFVFERFYRVDTSRSRESGGSGVGLTISRHLAWMMGGDLSVFSAGENQGSTFTLFLPLVI